MINKKGKVLIASLLAVLVAGGAVSMAYLMDATEWMSNVFQKGKKYTLVYHANTGSPAGDAKVNVPEDKVVYGDGTTPMGVRVSKDTPLREGFVFTGWYEKAEPEPGDTKYGFQGQDYIIAQADEYEKHLYAKWEAGYTLIYNANRPKGAKGNAAPRTETKVSSEDEETFIIAAKGDMNWIINFKEDPADAEEIESDEYRVFLGWSEDPNADVPTYTDTGKWAYTGDDYDRDNTGPTETSITIKASDTPSKTVTLYAVWANKYVLEYKKHPEMNNPAVGDSFPSTQTIVTRNTEHKFTLPMEKPEITPTRGGNYEWGWWGDNLKRFGYSNQEPTSAPVNEGCYLFGEPIKTLSMDKPLEILYAYFHPPGEVTITYDSNVNKRTMPSSTDYNSPATNVPKPDFGFSKGETYYYPVGGLSSLVPKHKRYVFQGWAETPDAKEKQYDPGDTSFRINIVLNNNVTLYAVWKAGHNYRLYFDRNAPTSSRIYYKNEGNWGTNNYSSNIYYNSDDPIKRGETPANFFTEPSFTWSKEFFSENGVFATAQDQGTASSAWTFTFLGWSKTKQDPNVDPSKLEVDFPVAIPEPADKENPNPLYPDLSDMSGNKGLITSDVTFDEPKASCTTPDTHNVTLYAVWKKSPKHQLALTFNKGTATNRTFSGNNYYAPSSSGYVASDKLTEKTWTANDLKNLTVPERAVDEKTGSSFEFLGWTDAATYSTLKDGCGTEEDVKIHVDGEGKIKESVTVKEPASDPADCTGGRHTDTYYPVFGKTARHKFTVKYDINAPSTANSVETYLYRSENGTDWSKQKVKGGSPVTGDIESKGVLDSKVQELSEPDYTYALNGKGMFATCSSTSANNFTFLGWSTEKYALGEYDPNNTEHHLDFPVTAPADPENPGSGEGTLSADLVIKEADENPQCSIEDNESYPHERTLYGVWSGEKLHQFAVVFVANADDAPDQTIVHGSKDNWADASGASLARSSDPIAKDEEDFKGTDFDKDNDGKVDAAVQTTWRTYSDAFRMPADTADSEYSKDYTFTSDYWNTGNRDIIVKAEAGDSNGYRYEFLGWSTDKEASTPNISVDADGYITTPLTVSSDEYPCESKTHHTVLYGVWKKTKIHNYQVIFYANGGNQIGYQDGSYWRYNSTSYIKGYSYTRAKSGVVGLIDPDGNVPNTMYYSASVTTDKDPVDTYTSHTWSATGPQDKRLRMAAKRADGTESDGNRYSYTFLGWGESPNGPVIATVDSASYLEGDISIEAPENGGECEHYTHTKVLYAIWNKTLIPKKHRFGITFDLNGGTRLRKYDNASSTWSDSSTYTYYDPNGFVDVPAVEEDYTWPVSYWTDNGLGGARRNSDDRWDYEFVGWSEEKLNPSEEPDMSKAIAWQHDDNSNNPGDGWIKAEDIVSAGTDTHSVQETPHNSKRLYAMWKRSPRSKVYTLEFDGNDGDADTAQNIPTTMSKTKTYDDSNPGSWNTHTFDLTATPRPTNKELVFAGWNENPDASTGVYGVPYTGEDEDEKELTKRLNPLFELPQEGETISDSDKEITRKLYAIWLYEYKLSYNANGGSGAPPHVHAYDRKAQKTTELRDVTPTREGYTFVEWNTAEDGSGDSYQPGQQLTMTAEENGKKEMVLYAVWKENE